MHQIFFQLHFSSPRNQHQRKHEENEKPDAAAIALLLRCGGRITTATLPVTVTRRVVHRPRSRSRVHPLADSGNQRDSQDDEQGPQKHLAFDLLERTHHGRNITRQQWQKRHAHHGGHQEEGHQRRWRVIAPRITTP